MSSDGEIIERLRSRPLVDDCLRDRSLEDAILYTQDMESSGKTEFAFSRFELLVLAGRLDEAETVLKGFAERSGELGKTCRLYLKLLNADRWRREWNRDGERSPGAFSPPPGNVKLHCKAWNEYHQKSARHAIDTLKKAGKRRPHTSGVLQDHRNDTYRFDDIRESDSFILDCLEVLTPGKFFLVPFSEIVRLALPRAERVRQSIYVPSRLVTRNGVDGLVWIPQYYAGTHFCENEESRNGRVTSWDELEVDFAIAFGPRKLQIFCANSLNMLGLDQILRIAFSDTGKNAR